VEESRVGTGTIQSVPHPLGAGEAEEAFKSVAGGNLPKWFVLGLVEALGGEKQQRPVVRGNLPSIRDKWVKSLPESLRMSATVSHVHPCWCALRLASGELEIHKSNGTIVAVDSKSSTVYLACATGDHKITRATTLLMNVVNKNSPSDEHGNVMPIVAGEVAREMCVHWVVLTKADLDTLKENKGKSFGLLLIYV